MLEWALYMRFILSSRAVRFSVYLALFNPPPSTARTPLIDSDRFIISFRASGNSEQVIMSQSTDLSGNTVDYKTGAIAWGAIGTNSQHSISQLLHQGKHMTPIDFLAPLSKKGNQKHHELLLANCLAQSCALMQGESNAKSHQHIDGNKPSTTILYDRLTPELLGSLLAMYEHRVFVQGLLLEINSFDQYGIELGKKMALDISKNIAQKEKNIDADSSTQNLIDIYKKSREKE